MSATSSVTRCTAFALVACLSGVGAFGLVDVGHLILHFFHDGVGFLVTQDLEHGGKQFLPVIPDMLLEGASELSHLDR